MLTRLQAKLQSICLDVPETPVYEPEESYTNTYEVNIDFDGASKAWKSNKISLGNGVYRYKKKSGRRRKDS